MDNYKDLKNAILKFKEGNFDFLIIIGGAGIGKTHNAREILGDEICYINSHATVLGLYKQAYEMLDMPIWFDDVESLFEQNKMIGLLKQFCETTEIKEIQYNTSWDMERTQDIPKKYQTKSKVLMTSNSITRLNNLGVQSLLDRAIIIQFEPSVEEIINYLKQNLKSIYDQNVIDYLCSKYGSFSLRDYTKTYQLNKSGLLKIK